MTIRPTKYQERHPMRLLNHWRHAAQDLFDAKICIALRDHIHHFLKGSFSPVKKWKLSHCVCLQWSIFSQSTYRKPQINGQRWSTTNWVGPQDSLRRVAPLVAAIASRSPAKNPLSGCPNISWHTTRAGNTEKSRSGFAFQSSCFSASTNWAGFTSTTKFSASTFEVLSQTCVKRPVEWHQPPLVYRNNRRSAVKHPVYYWVIHNVLSFLHELVSFTASIKRWHRHITWLVHRYNRRSRFE